MQSGEEEVDDEVIEDDGGKGDKGNDGCLRAFPTDCHACVQIGGVTNPRDECPRLFGIPAPVTTPCAARPDGTRNDSESPKREDERMRLVRHEVKRLRVGDSGCDCIHATALSTISLQSFDATDDQLQCREDRTDHEEAHRHNRRSHVNQQPVRLERRNQLCRLRVQDRDGQAQ